MFDTQATPLDTSCCPLCGGANSCAIALKETTGQAQPTCWCFSVSFSADLLVRLPADRVNVACICARCVADDAAAQSRDTSGA
jgi:hypothetical protein